MLNDIVKPLTEWYRQNKRSLPWRDRHNAYYTWVSEIMLQQTRVEAVKPYFRRFTEELPDPAALAECPEEKLLKLWEGLGYYNRVRNMQLAAQTIVEEYDGILPASYEKLLSLKGIGSYTAGAIASIAYDIPVPAVDGNVLRVITRITEDDGDIMKQSVKKRIENKLQEIMPGEYPGDFNQALMDLGSDIEAPLNPHPEDSPVKEFSAAYLHGTMDKYPIKAPKKKPVSVYLQGLIIENEQGQFLLEKNEAAGLLSGFWHFPLIEVEEFQTENQMSLFEVAENQPSLELSPQESFEQDYDLIVNWQQESFLKVQHVFSHRKWHIQLAYGRVKDSQYTADGEVMWLHPDEFEKYPFAKPQQKMWEAFNK